MKEIAYITNNIAPFRVSLLDELSKYAKVSLFYSYELEDGTNPNYVKKRPKKAKLINIKSLGILNVFKKISQMDYIIIDGYSGRDKLILTFLLLVMKKKYAVSIDGIIYKGSKGVKSGLKNIIKKNVLKNASVVYSTSEISDYNIKKISRSTNVKRHIFTTLYKKEKDDLLKNRLEYIEKSINQREKFILYVGKFSKEKGVREFVNATKNLEYRKVMVGGNISELRKLGVFIDEKYEVIPFLEKYEMLSLMKKARTFILPTYTDTWGLVIIEALSLGLPVVTTVNCNAGREFIKTRENGYLAQVGDTTDLEEGIKETLKLDEKKVAYYNKEIFKNYTLEEAALNMYNTLLEEIK